jgi:hypothetical protein
MPVPAISDEDLATVAAVAGREAWRDLGSPPADHGPRSLEEERAVQRYADAVPRPGRDRAIALRGRIALVVLTVAVLGACWWVSPTRTAIGLIGAGLFSLIALRRGRRKRARAAAARPASPWARSPLGR